MHGMTRLEGMRSMSQVGLDASGAMETQVSSAVFSTSVEPPQMRIWTGSVYAVDDQLVYFAIVTSKKLTSELREHHCCAFKLKVRLSVEGRLPSILHVPDMFSLPRSRSPIQAYSEELSQY